MTQKRVTYMRRCDECREPYEHVKGAPTGFCKPCVERLREYARELPVPASDHFMLPLVREFEQWS